ncbi:single-stranded DNA-binding protein [Virgibacillus salexigens]|uniref:Single-stranded DNA-binding protein n=1 Tax=Virgibacillus massiliensis TaxID=1462526 RepID=A0A024QH63_9BACI|nr:single-stranded DNA-binding protein [Virgibacillus massiliensis]CDQ41898.1 single-stranded DNA-binding protein [Virgibacillus massiliensis]
MNNNFNGGFNPGQQQGFPPQPNGNFNPNQNMNGGNQGGNSGSNSNKPSYNKFVVLANLTKDPEGKTVNNSKVASSSIAVNHPNNQTDFWDIEVWVNQGNSSGTHDFLLDYCKKGRQLLIEGEPYLKRRKRQINGQDVLDQNGKGVYDYYPTIKVTNLTGLAGGQSNNNNNSNQGNQQQGQQNNFNQQAPQPNGGFNPQQQQGGFAPQGNFGAPQGAPGMQQGAPNGQGFGPPSGQFIQR